MKKLFVIMFSMLLVFNLSGCEKVQSNTELETSNKTGIGYINEIHNKMVLFDEVEWVSVPSERATTLGITDNDAPNGFYIYNEDSVTQQYDIADKCEICILDWENNFVKKQIDLDNFIGIYEQRGNVLIPYTLTIENGKVINIDEHYIP